MKVNINTINYGLLSAFERDAEGQTYFGSGNLATGFHSVQAIAMPDAYDIFFAALRGKPAPQEQLLNSVGLKVHLRQGADIAPDNADGTHYIVPAGAQPGVPNRAAWNVDFSLYDNDGDVDFAGAVIRVDINPTEDVSWLTFHYDDGLFEARDANRNMRYLETGDGPANVLQDSINLAFFADLIDNDGDASNGFQAWDMSHGQFEFEVSQHSAGIVGTWDSIGAQTITSAVTIEIA